MIVPVNIANNFIRRGKCEDISITPLKLQKLIYFLYKDYLKTTNKILFTEPFETWSLGPVVPSVYAEFSSYGKRPIETYAKDSQGNSYLVSEEGTFKQCLDRTWNRYKEFSGIELSNKTHEPGTAWSKATSTKSRFLSVEDIKDEP